MQKNLIIEDDPAIRDELSLLLANEGCQAVAVTECSGVPGFIKTRRGMGYQL